MSVTPTLIAARDTAVFDSPSLVARYVRTPAPGQHQVTLAVDGITCAGCIARIESRLQRVRGVQTTKINPSTHQADAPR